MPRQWQDATKSRKNRYVLTGNRFFLNGRIGVGGGDGDGESCRAEEWPIILEAFLRFDEPRRCSL